jgi:hypothetical protein
LYCPFKRRIFYTSDPKIKNTPLLIYYPPKNSTLCIWSYLFIKEIIVFYVINIFTLHWNGVEKERVEYNWNIIYIKWMLIYLQKVQCHWVPAKTGILEKAVLQGFEGSVHLENNLPDSTFARNLNFATLFVKK